MLFLNTINTFTQPTYDIEPITQISVGNGIIEDIYVQQIDYESEIDFGVSSEVIDTWSPSTQMHARFEKTLTAGNSSLSAKGIKKIRIKRREVNNPVWVTVYEKEVKENSAEDYKIFYSDYFACANTEYDYGITTIHNKKGIEQEKGLVTVRVLSDFDGVAIADKDKIYYTRISGASDANINVTPTMINTLGSKYPIVIHNGNNQYYSGTLSGCFTEIDEIKQEINLKTVYKYNQELALFLANGKPKVIKDMYGRHWLVDLTQPPTMDSSIHPDVLMTSISWVEIGDINNDLDMRKAGMI